MMFAQRRLWSSMLMAQRSTPLNRLPMAAAPLRNFSKQFTYHGDQRIAMNSSKFIVLDNTDENLPALKFTEGKEVQLPSTMTVK